MTIHYTDDRLTLHLGKALEVLTTFPAESVDCIVTSPPYFGLRDYKVEGQMGLEETPALFVQALREVFQELHRVLANDGTCWLNLGDSYSASPRGNDKGWDKSRLSNPGRVQKALAASLRPGRRTRFDRAPKNMLGIPWRVAFALQDDGWFLRNEIIWHKPNGMPESMRDRLTNKHEHLFLLTKRARYWFDLDPIREPVSPATVRRLSQRVDLQAGSKRANGGTRPDRPMKAVGHIPPGHRGPKNGGPSADKLSSGAGGRNPGDVWSISTQPFTEAHFATMPVALAERCVLAGCKPGGVVLDPFSGTGTTGMAALNNGHPYIGIDLDPAALDISMRTRLAQTVIPAPSEDKEKAS